MHNLNTSTTPAPVQCQSENGSGTVFCESCPVEQRVRGGTNRLQTQVMAVSGKILARTETLQSIQRDREMRSMWFHVEQVAEGGCTGKHRETVPCPHMLPEVIHRLQESRTEPTKTVFEEALQIVKSEVKPGRTFPTREPDAEFSPAPGPAWNTQPKTSHGKKVQGTQRTARNSSQHWRPRVRKPETPHGTGRVLCHSVEPM